MSTRRDFLGAALSGSSLIALAPTVPGFLAQTARAAASARDGRVLVVLELNGGNDGINTVVPFADEGYAKHRKALRLPKDRLIKVNDPFGLHPSLQGFGQPAGSRAAGHRPGRQLSESRTVRTSRAWRSGIRRGSTRRITRGRAGSAGPRRGREAGDGTPRCSCGSGPARSDGAAGPSIGGLGHDPP